MMSDDLSAFLLEAELHQYYEAIKSRLKIYHVGQLKYVEEADLADLGMSKPEVRRLKKLYQREHPSTTLGRIKKRLHRSRSSAAESREKGRSIVPSKNIIPSDAIQVLEDIGQGEFSQVKRGIWLTESGDKVKVAIKCLGATQLQHGVTEFLKEAAVMQGIDHDHIVRFYGVVLDVDSSLMLVCELAEMGSLSESLCQERARQRFPVTTLCSFAWQIANGMSHLEDKRLVHRDLAARNILVFSSQLVKISDFGLSRAITLDQQYYKTEYSEDLRLPLAWMSPECINFLKFTTASDVWAFGVTLWEMFCYGSMPFKGLSGQEILATIDAPRCQRLEQPCHCPKELYAVMLQCWEHEPERRPTFAALKSSLTELSPSQVQAIRDSSGSHLLPYRKGDILTILERKPLDAPPGVWNVFRVASAMGDIGLVNIDHTQPYHTIQLQSSLKRSTLRDSKLLTRKPTKLSKEAISAPHDVLHCTHVGIAGDTFGDVASLKPALDEMKRMSLTPDRRTMNSSLSSLPINGTMSHSASSLQASSEDAASQLDAFDDDDSELESRFDLGLGPSLLDEVMRILDSSREGRRNDTPSDSTPLETSTPASSNSENSRGFWEKQDRRRTPLQLAGPMDAPPRLFQAPPKERKQARVKPMSTSHALDLLSPSKEPEPTTKADADSLSIEPVATLAETGRQEPDGEDKRVSKRAARLPIDTKQLQFRSASVVEEDTRSPLRMLRAGGIPVVKPPRRSSDIEPSLVPQSQERKSAVDVTPHFLQGKTPPPPALGSMGAKMTVVRTKAAGKCIAESTRMLNA